jgi:hypothetical protein
MSPQIPSHFSELNLCYIVLMANTSEHISIRIPKKLLEAVRRDALQIQRSVSWVIVQKLDEAYPGLPTARDLSESRSKYPGRYSSGEPTKDVPALPAAGKCRKCQNELTNEMCWNMQCLLFRRQQV